MHHFRGEKTIILFNNAPKLCIIQGRELSEHIKLFTDFHSVFIKRRVKIICSYEKVDLLYAFYTFNAFHVFL